MLSLDGEQWEGIPKLDHEHFMTRAIAAAQQAPRRPFGAVIVDSRNAQVVSTGCNRATQNPTWHGEIDAMNRLWEGGPVPEPESLVLYTTAEPCVMCQGAIVLSGIGTVVFGTSVATLKRLGWKQFDLSAAEVAAKSYRPAMRIVGGVLEPQCDELFFTARKGTER